MWDVCGSYHSHVPTAQALHLARATCATFAASDGRSPAITCSRLSVLHVLPPHKLQLSPIPERVE